MLAYKNNQGFSFLQLIISMTVLLVLAVVVFIWVDPLARIGETKNKRRISDVNIISLALFNYTANHDGNLPVLGAVTTNKKVLCSVQGGSTLSCAGTSELCLNIDDDDFYRQISALPYDPDKSATTDTGYYIQKDSNGMLIVGSCSSYDSVVITKKPNIKVSCAAYGGGNCWYEGASTNIDCDAVCSTVSLDCVTNAGYGPDKDSGGTAFCQLSKDLGKTCTSGCSAAATGTPPWFNTSASTCAISTGLVVCGDASGASNYPICACD